MRKILVLISIASVIVLFARCKSRARQTFEYIPLEEYKYNEAKIQHGTEVELLAFSGGEESDKESVYYYQFLVLDKTTGDTLRILAPLISVDKSAGLDNKTYTTPLQYNPDKGITRAFYEQEDSAQNLVLQIDKLTEANKSGDSLNIGSLMSKVDKRKFVVVNKTMPEFNTSRYRATVGVLNFMEIPW